MVLNFTNLQGSGWGHRFTCPPLTLRPTHPVVLFESGELGSATDLLDYLGQVTSLLCASFPSHALCVYFDWKSCLSGARPWLGLLDVAIQIGMAAQLQSCPIPYGTLILPSSLEDCVLIC